MGSTERLVPHSIEAEACVLGAMMLDPSVIPVVLGILTADDFFRPAHSILFSTILAMDMDNAPVDLVTMRARLSETGDLERVGGIKYLVELAEGVPGVSNTEYYAKIVLEKSARRDMIRAANQMVKAAYGPDDFEDVASPMAKTLDRTSERLAGSASPQAMVEVLDGVVELALSHADQKRQNLGLMTGFTELDSLMGGLSNGDFIVLAARPSMGKTALALDLFRHITTQDQIPALFFSMEMGSKSLFFRMLAAQAGVSLHSMTNYNLGEREKDAISMAHRELRAAPMSIVDKSGITLPYMKTVIRREVHRHGIQAVFIDYLQLLRYTGKADKRYEQVGETSHALKTLAMEYDIPIVCLAQLNRNVTGRKGFRPHMSDLRESGDIEQDADVVALLHSEDYYHKNDPAWSPQGYHEVILDKQRNGPTGVCRLRFIQTQTTFKPFY